MKKLLFISLLLVNAYSFSQIGIGTTTPNSSAALDVTSTSKGFLPPRMTNGQKIDIISPVAGLIVYCSNCGANGEIQIYNGVTWINFSGAATAASVPNAPTSPVATAGNAQASVAFTEPAFNGGSTIMSYTVTSSPGGFYATNANSPVTVTGLNNGTSYTFTVVATNAAGNSVTSSASNAVTPITIPDPPPSPVATAGYKQATVSFTAPAFNGGSAITNYTVTSSPDGFTATATSANSPVTFTGLTNGTSYTFTVVATNAAGNSPASSSVAVKPNCGAYISAGVYKTFECFNLGATDTTLDPDVPVQAIHGNYYQWGRGTVAATASTAAGAIAGWNAFGGGANGAWADATKTANDPCPTGFRVPTNAQWNGVINTALNTVSRTGSWTDSATNFSAAISWGPNSSTKTLTLPAAGLREADGALFDRGNLGNYWTSTVNGTSACWALYLSSSATSTYFTIRTRGFSVRCVSE